MEKKREAGIDLLRCLAAFLVVGFHGNLYVGYQGEIQEGLAMWVANSFYWLTVGCNGIFLMLSGYLHSEKTWDRRYYKGLFGVVLGYALASVLSIPVRHFLLGQGRSLGQWIKALLGFSGVYYGWFVEMYLGLMLVVPILNLGMKSMTGGQLLAACASMVAVTALPLTDYWAAAYPLAYYGISCEAAQAEGQYLGLPDRGSGDRHGAGACDFSQRQGRGAGGWIQADLWRRLDHGAGAGTVFGAVQGESRTAHCAVDSRDSGGDL